MARSLFIDDSLKFDGAEKFAGLLKPLGDNADQWPAEVLEAAHQQLPYLSEFETDVSIDKIDENRGYGYGSVMVRHKSDRMPNESGYKKEDTIHIPVVIRQGKMAPLDVYIDQHAFHPLTEGRLRAALFQPSVFDAPRERPYESSMYSNLQPPLESSTGTGGGGVKLGSDKGFIEPEDILKKNPNKKEKTHVIISSEKELPAGGQKVASVAILPQLQGRVNVGHSDRLKQAMQDPSIRSALAGASEGVQAAFETALSLGSHNPEKIASFVFNSIRPDTIQLRKLASGNFMVKWANAAMYAPQEQEVDAMTAQQLAEDRDIVQEAETDGSITLSMNAAVKETTADEEITTADSFGIWAVQDANGAELTGFVFPRILNFDMVALPLTLFTNGSQFGLQDKVAGKLVSKSTEIPNGKPQGYGAFYSINGGSATAFIPMHISGSFRGSEGAWRYQATTTLGDSIQICPTEGIKKPIKVDNEVCIPADYRWLPLKGETELISEPTGFMKTAMVKCGELISDGIKYTFRGPTFAKLAGSRTQFLNRHDAEFLGVAAGIHPLKIKEALNRAARGECVELHNLKELGNPAEKLAAARERVLTAVKEAELPPAYFLAKEAAVLEDALTADKILSLGFLNPENVATFVEMLPSLEACASNLAEMLVASRLGLRDVPEVALERALVALGDTITGLKRLKAKEISYI